MTRNRKIELLGELGAKILNDQHLRDLWAQGASEENLWFTKEFTITAMTNMAKHYLDASALENWCLNYTESDESRVVGLILAGNIPLVGIHDLLAVWLSGHKAKIKPSSKDSFLIQTFVHELEKLDPEAVHAFQFVDQLKEVDAVIATGSDNTNRYFEYYFRDIPHILRKNRVGISILTGNEDETELKGFVRDVLLFFGLGCRSTSKFYLPNDYNMESLQAYFADWTSLLDHPKFKNNYDYSYTIYLMNNDPIHVFGPTVLRESAELHSRIACLHYERYNDLSELRHELNKYDDQIQCVSCSDDSFCDIPLGGAQQPSLNDYSDGVDTMKFLQNI